MKKLCHPQESTFKVTPCVNIQQHKQKKKVYGKFLQVRSGSDPHQFCSHSTVKEAGNCILIVCQERRENGLVTSWKSLTHKGRLKVSLLLG